MARCLSALCLTATPGSRLAAILAHFRHRSRAGGSEVLGELGRGGMGFVYKARDLRLKRLAALKMVLAGGHAGAAELGRFRTEAEAVARLQHPTIVQIYVGTHDGLPFFALEFCAGGSLADRLEGTPLPAGKAARLVETLARAMDAAHRAGVIHRDLKPANVLLMEDGTPKVTDFGLAKKLDEAGQTNTGSVMGTPSYMAPEQAEGKKEVGPAADVYALGAILYELLTGRPPFKAATALDTVLQVISDEPVPPRSLQPKTPRDLETICLKCLHKEPGKRYASAADLAEDLRRFLDGEPIQGRPVGAVVRAVKWARRRPALAALAAVSVLAAAALLSGGLWYNTRLQAALGEAKEHQARAEEQRGRAEEQRSQAQQALEDSRRKQVGLNAATAERLLDEGDTLGALPALVEVLRLDPGREEIHRLFLGTALRQCPPLRQVWPHPGPVTAASLSPDGRRLVTAGDDGAARLWDAATAAPAGPPLRHGASVRFAAFSPDGRRVVTASADHTARVWDAASGQPCGPPLRHEGEVMWAAFSPDGKRLATAGADETARLWDATTGKPVAAPLRHKDRVNTVAFSPDGRRVLTASSDSTAQVWDASSGKPLGASLRHEIGCWVYCAAFSPDGGQK